MDFANTRLGHSRRVRPEIRYQLGRHLQLDLEHTIQNFDVDGGRLFTANLTNFRTTYQFNNRSFLRVVVQQDDRERNQDLYTFPVQSQNRELTSQLLYSYGSTPHPFLSGLFRCRISGRQSGQHLPHQSHIFREIQLRLATLTTLAALAHRPPPADFRGSRSVRQISASATQPCGKTGSSRSFLIYEHLCSVVRNSVIDPNRQVKCHI